MRFINKTSTSKIRLIAVGLILLVQLYCAIKYRLPFTEYVVIVGITFSSVLFFSTFQSVQKDFASLVLIGYIFLSSSLYPVFELGGNPLLNQFVGFDDWKKLSVFSNRLLLISFCALYIFKIFLIKTHHHTSKQYDPLKDFVINLFFVLIFAVSLLTAILGVGKMGHDAVELPFHLGGVFFYLKMNFAPLMFMLFIARSRPEKHKKYLLLILIFGVCESIVLMSKSTLITVFLPLSLYYVLTTKHIRWQRFVLALPILLFMYYTMEQMRVYSLQDSTLYSRKKVESSNPYERAFLNGEHYLKVFPYISDNIFFDFSKAKMILLMGGSPQYTTFIIDGYSRSANHSSGTTGIIDALLIGGYGLCYLMIILYAALAIIIDRVQNACLRVFFILIFYDLIRARSISIILMPELLVVYLLEFMMIYLLYRHRDKEVVW